MKRAIFDGDKFRISKPGVDVDLAQGQDFILHEDHLIAQPYFMQFIPCSLSGTNNNNDRSESVPVAVPELNNRTFFLTYLRTSDGVSYYPIAPNAGGVSPTGASCGTSLTGPLEITVGFYVPAEIPAPEGAFLLLFRGTTDAES